VGEDAVSGPDPGAFGAVDAGAVPAVAAFEVADAPFDAGPPFNGAAEGFSVFLGSPCLRWFAFAGITTVVTPRSACLSTLASP